VICLGPMGVLGLMDRHDMQLLRTVASNNSDVAMPKLLNEYPDLTGMPSERRVNIIYQKIMADHYALVPMGIWSGLTMSMLMFFAAGVGETMVAGPLLRNHSWYAAIVPYTELAMAIAALAFLGAIYLCAPLVMGAPMGFFGWWKLSIMIGSMIIAIWTAARHWHWVFRVFIQTIWIICFLTFLINDFMHLPDVGNLQNNIAKSRRLQEQNPENIECQLDLGAKYADLANYWFRWERWSDAVGAYEQVLDLCDSMQKCQLNDERKSLIHTRMETWNFSNFIKAFDHLGRYKDADRVFDILAPATPDHWHSLGHVLRLHCDEMIDKRASNAEECVAYVNTYVRDKLQTDDDTPHDELIDRLAHWITRRERWRVIGPFPGGADFKGLDTAFGPEKSDGPHDQFKSADRTLTWKSVSIHPGEYFNLLQTVSTSDYVVAYAMTSIESAGDQEAQLLIGSDDGCKIWLNGEMVYEARALRAHREGADRAKVTLNDGSNSMLVKVEQAAGDWGFSVDVVDEKGWPVRMTPDSGSD